MLVAVFFTSGSQVLESHWTLLDPESDPELTVQGASGHTEL